MSFMWLQYNWVMENELSSDIVGINFTSLGALCAPMATRLCWFSIVDSVMEAEALPPLEGGAPLIILIYLGWHDLNCDWGRFGFFHKHAIFAWRCVRHQPSSLNCHFLFELFFFIKIPSSISSPAGGRVEEPWSGDLETVSRPLVAAAREGESTIGSLEGIRFMSATQIYTACEWMSMSEHI